MTTSLKSDSIRILDRFPPSKALYDQIKGGFVSKGITLNEWIKENSLSMNSVRMAIHGVMNGPKGKELRIRAIKESGLIEVSKAEDIV